MKSLHHFTTLPNRFCWKDEESFCHFGDLQYLFPLQALFPLSSITSMVFCVKVLCIYLPASLRRKKMLKTDRNNQVFLPADLPLADLVNLPADSPLADLLTGKFDESAGRFLPNFCWQILWQSPNVLADLYPHFCWEVFWLADLVNLMADVLTGRFGESASRFPPNFCWQIFWQSPNLPADLPPQFLLVDFLTVTKSASIYPIFVLADFLTVTKSACRFTPHFCWQIFWQSPNLPADFPPISAGRFSDSHQICLQISPQFLLADFLTVTKSLLHVHSNDLCINCAMPMMLLVQWYYRFQVKWSNAFDLKFHLTFISGVISCNNYFVACTTSVWDPGSYIMIIFVQNNDPY